MIRPGDTPDTWTVDFSRVKRRKGGGLLAAWSRPAAVLVDGWAIGQALASAMEECRYESVSGRPQVWNEYLLFLAAEDHDRLRPLEETLREEVLALLEARMLKLDAVAVGPITVRLLVDDDAAVPAGQGRLRARHNREVPAAAAVPGEITLRDDRGRPSQVGADTRRVGGAVLRMGDGVVALPDGARIVLGRADPAGGDDHRALPGATPRINRRHLWVRVTAGEAEVGRLDDANPVSVAGQALAPGQSVRVALPAELVLSNEFRATLEAAR